MIVGLGPQLWLRPHVHQSTLMPSDDQSASKTDGFMEWSQEDCQGITDL